MGCLAIQVASILGVGVYATASSKQHEYLKVLGAIQLFDYKDNEVVENMVAVVKQDGVSLDKGYDAVGSFKECMEILRVLNPQGKCEIGQRSSVAGRRSEVQRGQSQVPRCSIS